MTSQTKVRTYSESAKILANPSEVFDYIDDHSKFSSHMNTSSPMMGGGKMNTYIDELKGKTVGSHIKMDGKVFGIYISLDEVVTEHVPPHRKVWKTVGTPKLLIIGQYQMKVEIEPDGVGSRLTISIDYDLPKSFVWLGRLLSGWYAKWCVQQMLYGTQKYFIRTEGGEHHET